MLVKPLLVQSSKVELTWLGVLVVGNQPHAGSEGVAPMNRIAKINALLLFVAAALAEAETSITETVPD